MTAKKSQHLPLPCSPASCCCFKGIRPVKRLPFTNCFKAVAGSSWWEEWTNTFLYNALNVGTRKTLLWSQSDCKEGKPCTQYYTCISGRFSSQLTCSRSLSRQLTCWEPNPICNEPSASRKQQTKRNDNKVSNISSSCHCSGGKQQTK